MIIAITIVSIVAFFCLLQILGVVRVVTELPGTVQCAVAILRDSNIDDQTREKELQRISLKLFSTFISTLVRSIFTILASLFPIWIASFTGLVRIGDVIQFLTRWDVIVIATALVVSGYTIRLRLQPSTSKAFKVNYSAMDRLLHRVAFGTPSIQLTAADLEKKFLSSSYEKVEIRRPIFITSLPRAGTTLMLEVLCRFPSLAPHTYRDMPFVMAPVLWSRFSSPFRKHTELIERAHSDGMQVGYDSPEAFEEVLWHTFWPEKYGETRIEIWEAADGKEEALAFFAEHMKKIIALRLPDRKHDGRYISKNNANIARIDLISQMFPDSKILIPVRHPIPHAASLLRQHHNFLEMQKKDSFIRRYMADIGHYDFGELHRPIGFTGIEKMLSDKSALKIDYWLSYWIVAFEHIFAKRDKVTLVSYEATCAGGRHALGDICTQFEIPEEGMLDMIASIFKMPSPMRVDKNDLGHRLRGRAEELYEALIEH